MRACSFAVACIPLSIASDVSRKENQRILYQRVCHFLCTSLCIFINPRKRYIRSLITKTKTMANMKVILVAAIACLAMPSEAIDCTNNACSRNGLTHTLCLYQNPNPAQACCEVHSIGFSQSEKDEIVRKHNDLRQWVASGNEKRGNPGPQPAATNMQIMSWDDELATVAQRWANQCNFGHDSCRDVERFAVGQNVASHSTTGEQKSTPSDMIMMWYDEVTKMDHRLVDKLTGSIRGVGHYTQLVWADSNKIGCGKVIHKCGKWTEYYMVCNYGPAGNWMESPIYKRKIYTRPFTCK